MYRIITNRFRSRRNLYFVSFTAIIFSLLVLSWFHNGVSVKLNSASFENSVVLSQRGISSSSTSTLMSSNYSAVENLRRKIMDRTGVWAPFKPGVQGIVNVHLWLNLCGNNILTLKLFPLFPNVPSIRKLWSSLDISNLAPNYGKRVFGYLITPTSGKYSFRLKFSGTAEFWLSTDDKPENSRCLLCLMKGNEATTNKLSLENSKSYYFEMLHKHGDSQAMDSLLLQWNINNSKFKAISKKYLRSYQEDTGISEDVVNVINFPQSKLKMHGKSENMKSGSSSQRISREEIYKLPFIAQDLIEDLFPRCKYKPDYLLTYKLDRYGAKWENIYTSVYPSDNTNVTDSDGFVTFGNDILLEDKALQIVGMIMKQFKKKGLRQFQLENVINVEEKKERFLVELQLLDKNTKKSVRFSEYLYLSRTSKYLCYPEGFKWNKTSMVNVIVTAGRNQGRWVYHFIQNMEKIYQQTKDKNFNVIINDFLCPDADIRQALETSSLPNYLYLGNRGDFHKTLGLQQAAGAVVDGIVTILDLHLEIPSNYIDDIRKYTVQGVQFYSPILQRFECGTNTAVDMGSYWEFHGYGLVGIYKEDWDKFGGMNVEEFKHKWGGEDIEMHDRILMAGFEGYRKKVKGLAHYYHSKSGMWNKSNKKE